MQYDVAICLFNLFKMNILHNQHKHLLVANRVAFMIIEVLEAAWAPLVPYVKRAFAIDEGTSWVAHAMQRVGFYLFTSAFRLSCKSFCCWV